jgi:hypothetical protein
VFDARVSVGDHGHVVLEQRTALRDHHHAELARRRDHLLALLAPGLVVTLHAKGAHRLQPA